MDPKLKADPTLLEPATRRRRNGYTWRFHDRVEEADLEAVLGAFPDLGRLKGVSVLKTNQFRTVFLVPPEVLGGGQSRAEGFPDGLIAKVYRYTKLWDRLRYRLIRSRADQEWHALARFEAAGLPTATPVAVAELKRGGSVSGGGLLIRYLGGTAPLASCLSALETAPEREGGPAGPLAEGSRRLLEGTGSLVRRMHDHGIWHRDLHAGNILVSSADGRLHFIDLHSCLFLHRLGAWQRRNGVAKLLLSIRGCVPREGIRVLLEAYGIDALHAGAGIEGVESRLLARVRALERRRLRSRSKRCFIQSTAFSVHRTAGVRIYHARRHSPAELEPLWRSEPHGLRVLKSSAKGWVAASSLADRPVCVKHRRYGPFERIRSIFEGHRLRRAYGGGHALKVRKIPTPQVIALRERRFLGMTLEAHLVTELVEGGVPLGELLFREYWGRPPAAGERARRKRVIARAVGEIVRSVHDAGLCLHDLSPQNLLVSWKHLEDGGAKGESELLHVIDLDHLYLWKPLFPWVRRRNLIQIANLPEGHVTTADRLRGLDAYSRGNGEWRSARRVRSLRRGLLEEHLRALEALERGERARARTRGGDGVR